MTQPSARERLEQSLARIADPAGEGARACLTLYADAARAAADAADARARAGMSLGPLDGAVVTIKDLFDVEGEVTRAGSKVLASEGAHAKADAPVVQRLRRAGAVIVAKTNMTEFAFSGIGANPHFGTPGNPADRARAPGGSSSGGAVAVADGMCHIAIGSDTGGSTRVPAAFCGIVGYKPSRQRVPTAGAFPLSHTVDSIGPMARRVAECAQADAVMATEEPPPLHVPLAGLRIGVAQGVPLNGLDETVSAAFARALEMIGKTGARITGEAMPLVDEMMNVNAKGGIVPAEAYAVHRERLAARGEGIDPNVRMRIERAASISAADYVDMLRRRAALVRAMHARLEWLDALVMPTVAIVAPVMADIETREGFGRANAISLRNTSIANFFDLCAISLPLPRDGGLPVGLMLMGRNGDDRRLFAIAAAVERLFA
jgi:aspartyl-tRNA(Asn)/glutamyl-tRNA(Gln) amidotransferase subunit A